MGRLTLNILLSFAQFERELIGERVRDKIAASKKKGMWMGGTVPLGYDVRDRKLVVNESEAGTVVDIFRRYLRLKSVRALAEELAVAGIRSKRRYHPDGTEYGNQRFSHGALYLMLQNRTYRGEATHKGQAYPGEHSAIVEQSLWDAVQAVLTENRVARANGANTKQPSLLTGMIFDEAGERSTPTWSVKKGTRYRYYVSTSLVTGSGPIRSSRRRIPAGNLEGVVIDRLCSFFANQGEVLDAISGEIDEHVGHGQLIDSAKRIASKLDGDESETVKAILNALIRRVEVAPDCVKIDICRRELVTKLTVHDIAREEQVTAAYVYTLLRLPWLAPDITTAIVEVGSRHNSMPRNSCD
jgi:site-specific DNA recombinase